MKSSLMIIMLATFITVKSQDKLPIDAVTGKVHFKTTIKIAPNLPEEKTFALAKEWFEINTNLFTRLNRVPEMVSEKPAVIQQRNLVQNEFANKIPLQSVDPASNRLTGKVMLQYNGTKGSSIQHLYVQYYLILQVKGQELLVEATELRYNHFNAANYKLQRILNYTNSSACEAIDYMETLIACENSHAEFTDFYRFFNADVNTIFGNLEKFIKEKNKPFLLTKAKPAAMPKPKPQSKPQPPKKS
jgi:hypothetical protein